MFSVEFFQLFCMFKILDRHRRSCTVRFGLYETCRSKFTGTESRLGFPGAAERGRGEGLLLGTGFPLGE